MDPARQTRDGVRTRGLHSQYARAGENHGHAKLTEMDVALVRLIAAARALPRGWILDFANTRGVSDATVVMAIGGRSWAHITDPKPVASFKRHISKGSGSRTRPYCPSCDHAKCYPFLNGKPCHDRFHTVDHRQFTSPKNAKLAHAANARRNQTQADAN